MRIHSDTLTVQNLYEAARTARVGMEVTIHGSRKRDRAFNVNLTGESRRRPNRSHESHEYAATWDQWGVFLAVLFNHDENLTIPTAYKDKESFNYRTDARFAQIGGGWSTAFPADYHGDHRFKYTGTPFQQECVKCSAVTRWEA